MLSTRKALSDATLLASAIRGVELGQFLAHTELLELFDLDELHANTPLQAFVVLHLEVAVILVKLDLLLDPFDLGEVFRHHHAGDSTSESVELI